MTSKYRAPDGVYNRSAIEEDVEGHGLNKKSAPDGIAKSRAADDDVEGHVKKAKAPDGVKKAKGLDDDDDVEGHMIGSMNPVMARELARAKERDVQRAASRGSLISDAKRALRRKD